MPTTLMPFTARVFAMANTEGIPYLKPTNGIAVTELLGERLNDYAARTQCLETEGLAFTPIVGTRVYDYSQTQTLALVTYLAAPLCMVTNVFLNGAYLTICEDVYGRPGESSERIVSRNLNYLTQASGLPRYWWQKTPNKLCFDRAFDQVYTNCFVSGRLYHTPLTQMDQAIDFADEDIEHAAVHCAISLLKPYSPEVAAKMAGEHEKWIKQRLGECASKITGTESRGSGTPRRRYNMAEG